MDSGSFSVIGCDDWSARDDVRLLDGIEQYGYGNWVDVAEHIERHTPDEAEERYVRCFLNGTLGQLTMPQVSAERRLAVARDHTAADGCLSPSVASRPPPLLQDPAQTGQLIYMPMRDDFEREHDNGSERLVSKLNEASVEDEDVDAALKLAHVDMYIHRLRERVRRKRVARAFQLASAFFEEMRKDMLQQTASGSSKIHRRKDATQLSEKLRLFGQFMSRSDFDRLLKNIQLQRDLAGRVRKLVRYRRNGIISNGDCLEFERALTGRKSSATASAMTSASTSVDQSLFLPPPVAECKNPEPLNESSGFHMLSSAERRLCARLRLRPASYIAYKSMALCDSLSRRETSIASKHPAGWDVQHCRSLLTFFETAGWLTRA